MATLAAKRCTEMMWNGYNSARCNRPCKEGDKCGVHSLSRKLAVQAKREAASAHRIASRAAERARTERKNGDAARMEWLVEHWRDITTLPVGSMHMPHAVRGIAVYEWIDRNLDRAGGLRACIDELQVMLAPPHQ